MNLLYVTMHLYMSKKKIKLHFFIKQVSKITYFCFFLSFLWNRRQCSGFAVKFPNSYGCLVIGSHGFNSYSGTVVSYLTAPKIMSSINTLDDLAASKDVGILMVDNNVMGQQIMVLRYPIK
jgi:hypothetical protein